MRLRLRTFRDRLAVTMTVMALAILGAAGLAVYVGARQALYSSLDSALLGIARAEVASAVDDPDEGIHVHETLPLLLELSGVSTYEKLAQITDPSGRVVAQTHNLDGPLPLPRQAEHDRAALNGKLSFADLQWRDREYRAVYHPVSDPHDRPYSALVAVPWQPTEHSLRELTLILIACLAAGTFACAWGARRLAQRLTRPLERIAAAAHDIGNHHPGARIPPVSSDTELRELSDCLNDMVDRLERALVAQRRLVADASHELRTPLANVRGTVEVALLRPRSEEEYRETLEAVLPEIERLGRLVDSLLTLSRADSGQLTLDREICDLSDLARSAVEAARSRAAARNVCLEAAAGSPLSVEGDRDRLREVIDNLIDNALRHAPTGSQVLVEVSGGGDAARVRVRDQGPGIDPDEIDHIFERFYRTEAARDRHSGGSGLGLAISHAIARAHGGDITVENRRGHGASFTLVLPAFSRPS